MVEDRSCAQQQSHSSSEEAPLPTPRLGWAVLAPDATATAAQPPDRPHKPALSASVVRSRLSSHMLHTPHTCRGGDHHGQRRALLLAHRPTSGRAICTVAAGATAVDAQEGVVSWDPNSADFFGDSYAPLEALLSAVVAREVMLDPPPNIHPLRRPSGERRPAPYPPSAFSIVAGPSRS